MATEYTKAVRNLLTRCERAGVPGQDIAGLFAVIRGPDAPDPLAYTLNSIKAKFTAPLRLWLLGPMAYEEAQYDPRLPYVSDTLLTPGVGDATAHYTDHISMAVDTIKKCDIARAK